jgi:ABC-2 type transport system ATP-binding protein
LFPAQLHWAHSSAGKENLELVGRLYHLDWREVKKRSENLLGRFSLVDAANRTAKTYSGGMRRRLDLAASLVGEPEVLFLDEPTTGLDPRSRQELWEVLEELVKDGTTLLLTTQYLEEADYLANTIALIDKGGVIAQGTAKELKNNIGGGVLELHINDKEKIAEAALVLDKLFHTAPEVDGISGKIIIKETGGTKTLLEAVRAMDYFKIDIADIELRKPTLDEVFLTLTGKGKE